MSLKDDLIDIRTDVFKALTVLDKEASRKRYEAERVHQLNNGLVYDIQNEYITDYKDIEKAIYLLYNSNLTVGEILEIVRKKKRND